MIHFIKNWYYKRLFLKIYFSYLNHPNQKDPEYAFGCATADFAKMKEMFRPKKVKEAQAN